MRKHPDFGTYILGTLVAAGTTSAILWVAIWATIPMIAIAIALTAVVGAIVAILVLTELVVRATA